MDGQRSPNGAHGSADFPEKPQENRKCTKNRRRKQNKRSIQTSNVSNDDGLIRDGCVPSSSNKNDAANAPKPIEKAKVNSTDECKFNLSSPKFSMEPIPEFDPSHEESNIDNFLLKVNECAEKCKWNDEDTTRYALSKLRGGAKVWLQNQISVTHSWARWQDLLRKAFPYNAEYPELLGAMLDRHLKLGDDLEEYYSDKMALLYPCDINGNKAVDCIIHGIEDFNLKIVATAAQCSEPIELLNLLKDVYCEQGDSGGWCV